MQYCLVDDSRNECSIYRYFRIFARNMRDRHLNLQTWKRSNVVTLILTIKLGIGQMYICDWKDHIVMQFLFRVNSNVSPVNHPLRDVYSWDVHDIDLGIWNWQRSNVNMPIERTYSSSFVTAIVMYFLPFDGNCNVCLPSTRCSRIENIGQGP